MGAGNKSLHVLAGFNESGGVDGNANAGLDARPRACPPDESRMDGVRLLMWRDH